MKVKDLIVELKSMNPELDIILQKDNKVLKVVIAANGDFIQRKRD